MTIPNARGASDTLVRVVREQSSLVRRLTCVRSVAVCAAPPSLATRSPHVARPRGPHVTWGPSLHARAPLPALLLVLPAGLLCPGGASRSQGASVSSLSFVLLASVGYESGRVVVCLLCCVCCACGRACVCVRRKRSPSISLVARRRRSDRRARPATITSPHIIPPEALREYHSIEHILKDATHGTSPLISAFIYVLLNWYVCIL